MGAFGNVIGALFRRPFIIIFFSIFALLYSLFGYLFPVLNLLVIANSFITGDLFLSLVSLIQWILKLVMNVKGILLLAAAAFTFSFLIGIILSGYFVIINNTLDKKPKVKGEFMEGFRKYFVRTWFAAFVCACIGIAFILILMVVWIPALIITKGATDGKSGFLILSVLIDFVTVGVTFLALMFFRIYLVFWFPSIFVNNKGAFLKGKILVDRYFWKLVVRFLIMDIIFIVFQMFAVKAGTSIIFLPVKWIFNSVFFGFNIIYMFSLFKTYTAKIDRQTRN